MCNFVLHFFFFFFHPAGLEASLSFVVFDAAHMLPSSHTHTHTLQLFNQYRALVLWDISMGVPQSCCVIWRV